MSARATISVAVVSYQTRDDLRACLAALRSERWNDVVVVDNASSDGSGELVRSEFAWASVIQNDTNRGYGAAANQALSASRSDYVLLLNADTVPEPDTVGALRGYLDEHPRVAIAGPRLLDPDGSHQPSCYPFLTPWNALLVLSGLTAVIGRIPWLRERHLPTARHDRARAVPWVKGAALAARREPVLQIGGFDEGFFMYGEELDLAYRLHARGWEVHFAPVASVSHREGASTPAGRPAIELHVYRNLVRFYRLHYSRERLVALGVVVGLLMTGRIVRDSVSLLGKRDRVRRRELRASIDVWRRILLRRLDGQEPPPSETPASLSAPGRTYGRGWPSENRAAQGRRVPR